MRRAPTSVLVGLSSVVVPLVTRLVSAHGPNRPTERIDRIRVDPHGMMAEDADR